MGFCNVHAMRFLRGRNRIFIYNLDKLLRFRSLILDPDYGTNTNLSFVTHEDTEIFALDYTRFKIGTETTMRPTLCTFLRMSYTHHDIYDSNLKYMGRVAQSV